MDVLLMRRLFLLVGFSVLFGCTSPASVNQNTPPTMAAEPTEKLVTAKQDKPVAKEVLVVKSSQGTQTIEPTVVSYNPKQIDDPLEFINRPIFSFNDAIYRNALIPLSEGYLETVPEPVRDGVSNFFNNIREPLNFANHVFQIKPKEAGTNLVRFVVNTTVGLLGFFDPATAWLDLPAQKSRFNDTLAHYDVGHGVYLVLPVLGQSDLRNGFSTIIESQYSLIKEHTDNPETMYIQGYGSFHEFAPKTLSYEELRAKSDDPYLFFRNLYMQQILRDEQFEQD
ncbi:MlaA family lipoprotein [Flocculibacter collagenilyticus]|uniref:MlaA family lipoprotein n=1 Tax=Flocculibacter collagenilyticus TaxID=2744479 RepID=UPI001F42B08D|nr:VacJ family lipoprotein [Flocculibacter collagenilyticus]